MNPMHLLFMVGALVCFILAALGVNAPRIQLGWTGLALWIASLLSEGRLV